MIFSKKLMNIVILLLNSKLVFGIDNPYTEYDNCKSLNNMILCDNVEVCPNNYHTCNTYDIDIILSNEDNYINNKNSYYTNIGSNNEKCELCNNNPSNDVLTIEPITNNREKNNYCMIDNKRIKEGKGIKISKCIMCICEKSNIKCVNTCNNNKKNIFVTGIDNGLNNCIGLINSNPNKVSCMEYLELKKKNLACCVNNACKLNNCVSCMNYGNNEECNECEKGYYLNTYSKNRCHSIDIINQICNNHYSLDDTKQIFTCLKCLNGKIEYNTIEKKNTCVCNKGYFGLECDKNYDIIKCSGNGNYDIDNDKCICKENYVGKECETNILYSCRNGFYNSKNGKCICNYGYIGKRCDYRIKCLYGRILFNTCICNYGFSGYSCSIPFPQLPYQRERYTNLLLSSYIRTPCKNGILINNRCVCFNGYTGNDCGNLICKNGYFNSLSNTCSCFRGYYGKYCEYNCYEKCSYNGNKCHDKYLGKCICNRGWYGSKCNILYIDTRLIQSRFLLTNSIYLYYRIYKFNFSIHLITNRIYNVLPFKIRREKYNRLLRTRRNLKETEESSLFINTSIGLNEHDDYYYIYPDNNYTLSYFSGKTINISEVETNRTYYIYIEKLRNTTNDTDIIENNNSIHDIDNESSVIDNGWLFVVGGLIFSIFIIFIIDKRKRIINKKKNTDKIIINHNPLYTKINHITSSEF
jgi:hypothetical protein